MAGSFLSLNDARAVPPPLHYAPLGSFVSPSLPPTLFLCRFSLRSPMQRVVAIRAHREDVNAVAFLDESSNLFASGSDDYLCKVRKI